MKNKLIALALCVLMLFSTAAQASGSVPGRVESLAGDILALQLRKANANDVQAYLDQAEVGAEWYVITLSQTGSYDLSAYRSRLESYLAEKTVSSPVTRLKYALTLLSCGSNSPWIASTLAEAAGQQGLMSWVWALHLMNNGVACESLAPQAVVDTLLSLQLEDGGWALSGSVSDVDVTAMTLQALAPHAQDDRTAKAIGKAVALLSSRQMEDGGFASYGTPNPESAAQVLIALCSLGVDGLEDERFIQNGCTLLDAMAAYRLEDGSFSHTLGGTSNGNATVQVFEALTAWQLLQSGQGSLFLLKQQSSPAPRAWGYRAIAAVCILAGALLGCAVLFILKKRHWKNFMALLLAAAVLIALVYTVDIQSAGSYYSGQPAAKTDPIGTVTLSIRCDTVAGAADHIPADGTILPETSFTIQQEDTVYTILTEAARAHGLHMESSGTAGMMYVAGIGNLYEFDFGDLSGWMYRVNGESASVGCDQYALQDGDEIQWLYSCTMGSDLP